MNKQWVYRLQYWFDNKVYTKYIHGFSIKEAIENSYQIIPKGIDKLEVSDIKQEYFGK